MTFRTSCGSVDPGCLLRPHLVIPEQQRVEGVGQVEGQRGGGGDGAGVHQAAGGRGHGLAQLPQEDLGAGQQQSGEPHQQQLQQHRAAALHPPGLRLGRGGGGVETIDAQSAESEGGDAQRHGLQRGGGGGGGGGGASVRSQLIKLLTVKTVQHLLISTKVKQVLVLSLFTCHCWEQLQNCGTNTTSSTLYLFSC